MNDSCIPVVEHHWLTIPEHLWLSVYGLHKKDLLFCSLNYYSSLVASTVGSFENVQYSNSQTDIFSVTVVIFLNVPCLWGQREKREANPQIIKYYYRNDYLCVTSPMSQLCKLLSCQLILHNLFPSGVHHWCLLPSELERWEAQVWWTHASFTS